MLHFAFVSASASGTSGFFIANGESMGWRNLPGDLATDLDTARKHRQTVHYLAIGLDNDWFLTTDSGYYCKKLYDRPDTVSNVETFCQHAQDGGLDLSQYNIEQLTFVPDTEGYIVVIRQVADGRSRCAWSNVPALLDAHLSTVAGRGVKCVTVGFGGSWVVILEDGTINWRDIPRPLSDKLHAPLVNGAVEFVALSLSAHDPFFLVYANGVSDYVLPREWHSVVDSYRAAGTSATSSSYHSATSLQFSPLSPLPPLGYINHFNNIYSAPPQMPVYSEPQSQDGGSGIASASNIQTGVKVLSGLVKFASAVMPTMQGGDVSNFIF